MTTPGGPDPAGPAGYTYGAVVVRVGDGSGGAGGLDQVLDTLCRIRFSGWVAPPEEGWVVVVAASGDTTVASGRRGVVGVGEALAGTAVAVRVVADRQLALVAWADGREVARYLSDPSAEPGADEDVLPDPLGVEDAEAVAEACGRPEAAEALAELLAEGLDPEEEIESERLGGVLRLLGLPAWLVTAWRLPREMPTGPSSRELVRLGAGRTGAAGWLAERGARVVRRWRAPPPIVPDPPRGELGTGGMEWWLA